MFRAPAQGAPPGRPAGLIRLREREKANRESRRNSKRVHDRYLRAPDLVPTVALTNGKPFVVDRISLIDCKQRYRDTGGVRMAESENVPILDTVGDSELAPNGRYDSASNTVGYLANMTRLSLNSLVHMLVGVNITVCLWFGFKQWPLGTLEQHVVLCVIGASDKLACESSRIRRSPALWTLPSSQESPVRQRLGMNGISDEGRLAGWKEKK
ncbi:hypothetical protein EVAR_20496_1 [Eumeta japonica]|uniref:Uncharacterized protein n=1 Tax=Eumeta variegata TaxID=151549 RepID=A0A4C1YA95_EUMVA|nr:hypothetical protein EVAR_20496_1 [Eumeta japonica]